jgi:LPXTG-motif cell wall-anchored protein
MRVTPNTVALILGIALLLALVIFVKSRRRRPTAPSLARLRRTRGAANNALRTRLVTKVGPENKTANVQLGQGK